MHTFHIPVMGISFTIDTPIRVAHLGIDSVISIVEDDLLEKARMVHSHKEGLPFVAINKEDHDYRAKRVTAYLNLVKKISETKFKQFTDSCTLDEAINYFQLQPDTAVNKREFSQLMAESPNSDDILKFARAHAVLGSIDVNIMTKVDKVNYKSGEPLAKEFNDAHACLRGYANSKLESSLVLSAGFNPSLYGYISKFDDFFPNEAGEIAKKVILKVSDYRSALIQGKFLAKKGIWTSEFRVESGLNCGGHAFATEGYLLGPILEEFRQNKEFLKQSLHDLLIQGLNQQGRLIPGKAPQMRVTTQGGVGTSEEHRFLLDYYGLDSVGWGSPFLLVPEVTCVDQRTREQLRSAKENDLYLSEISPLGVPFNNIRNNSKDLEKQAKISQGKPGSPCIRKHLSFNTEFTDKPICTASRQYQNLKIKALNEQKLDGDSYKIQYDTITDKTCICTGLGTSFLIENNLNTDMGGEGVSVCPGPNIAYFNKVVSLKDITDHIYGRLNVMSRPDRPHMFAKELGLYVDYLKGIINNVSVDQTDKYVKRVKAFAEQLNNGVRYYKDLLTKDFLQPLNNNLALSEYLQKAEQTINTIMASFSVKDQTEGLTLLKVKT